jgi:hypothetical protein
MNNYSYVIAAGRGRQAAAGEPVTANGPIITNPAPWRAVAVRIRR